MIRSSTEVDSYGPRLPKGQTEGTLADLKTVPTHYKVTLSNVDEEQLNKIAHLINSLNMRDYKDV